MSTSANRKHKQSIICHSAKHKCVVCIFKCGDIKLAKQISYVMLHTSIIVEGVYITESNAQSTYDRIQQYIFHRSRNKLTATRKVSTEVLKSNY